MQVLAAFDKFRGTATADELGAAVGRAARRLGWEFDNVSLSDGGEGLLEVFGGANRASQVTGPAGLPVEAGWRLDGDTAVIECALASGLVLAGGAERNDAVAATSRGTGELIEGAVRAGARQILVGLGGSAGTDGGLGAVDALSPATLLALARGDVELVACCDVRTTYVDAAVIFAPQKGASPRQIELLTHRLRGQVAELAQRFGVDVSDVVGSGAAGGLGGGLRAVGGSLRPGFEVVAERRGLAALVGSADLVLTGEGRLDASSLDGKVVGGVAALAADAGTPVTAVVGEVQAGVEAPFPVVSLTARFGSQRSLADAAGCVELCAAQLLGPRS